MHRYISIRVACVLMFAVLLAIYIASTFSSFVSADTEQPSWLSTSNPSIQKQYDLSPADSLPTTIAGLGNRDCETNTVITRPFRVFQVQQTAQSCFVKTSFGLVDSSGSYMSFNGTGLAGQVANYSAYFSGMIAVPNSTNVIHFTSAAPNGLFLYLTRNVPSPLKTEVNTLTGEITYRFVSSAELSLHDDTGALLAAQTDSMSFSSNGKWMVVDLPNRAMSRINMDTLEILPFMNAFPYNNGDSPGAQTAVSNDGRYAIISSKSYSFLRIFDLSTCKDIPTTISGPAHCESRDLLPFMQSQFSGYIAALQFRFASDNIINFYAVFNPGSGTVRTRTTLLAPGQTQTKVTYIGMGDSFASGEGDNLGGTYYEPGTDAEKNKCHLSQRSYPYLLRSALTIKDFHSVACSGAEIKNISSILEQDIQYPKSNLFLSLGKWIPAHVRQLDYIDTSSPPDFLTISVGGNNVGFADILAECATSHHKIPLPNTCTYASSQQERANMAKRISDQYSPLKSLYQELIKSTNKKTKIYIVGYPQFINGSGGSCGINVHLNDEERYFVSQSTHYMNQVIKAAAEAAGVYYLDIEDALQGKNLCSIVADNLMSVNGLTEGNDKQAPWWAGYMVGGVPGVVAARSLGIGNESFHPNSNGHILIENKILGLTGGDLGSFQVCTQTSFIVCPRGDGKIPLPDNTYFGTDATYYVNGYNTAPTAVQTSPPQPASFIVDDIPPSNQVHLRLDYLLPGSSVTITARSGSAIPLGQYIVNLNGTLDTIVPVPANVAAGFHSIHIESTNIANEPRDYYESVFVPGPSGDINGNGILDIKEACGLAAPSGIDNDADSIDDACDGDLSTPISPKVTVSFESLRIVPAIPR